MSCHARGFTLADLVIGLAIAATFWLKDDEKYRRFVVIPASALIALAGIFWAIQRIA